MKLFIWWMTGFTPEFAALLEVSGCRSWFPSVDKMIKAIELAVQINGVPK